MEVNTVRGFNLGGKNFVKNNDLNATATCVHVKAFPTDDGSINVEFTLHVFPHFWELLFSSSADKRIKVVSPLSIDNPATTCVRGAYKSKEMNIKFDMCGLDPLSGTLAKSQKEKYDTLRGWSGNPFTEFNLKQVKSHYVLKKKHNAGTNVCYCIFTTILSHSLLVRTLHKLWKALQH